MYDVYPTTLSYPSYEGYSDMYWCRHGMLVDVYGLCFMHIFICLGLSSGNIKNRMERGE